MSASLSQRDAIHDFGARPKFHLANHMPGGGAAFLLESLPTWQVGCVTDNCHFPSNTLLAMTPALNARTLRLQWTRARLVNHS